MKIAIIGCGAISEKWHIPAAIELLGAKNVSIVDVDKERLEFLGRKFGIASFGTRLLEIPTSLDAVIIAAPPHAHPAIAEEAFGNGLSVLCEKPLANRQGDCARILSAAKRNKRILAVCHTYRFFPNRIGLRNMILSGELGRQLHMDIQQGHPVNWPAVTGYAFQKELCNGGVLLDAGLHSLDFILWCFGIPNAFSYVDDSIGGIESNALLTLRYDNSREVILRNSRTWSLSNQIIVSGDRGIVRTGIYDINTLVVEFDGSESVLKLGTGGETFYDMAIVQLNDFVSSVNQNKEPSCDGDHGALVVHFIENCYEIKRNRTAPRETPLPGAMW